MMGQSEKNNVISFLHRHLKNNPQKTVFYYPKIAKNQNGEMLHESIALMELVGKTSRLAQSLIELGLKPGDRVLIFLPMGLELYLAMFAVLQVGAVAVFLDSWARREQLGLVAKSTEPALMISIEPAFALAQAIPELDQIPGKIVAGSKSPLAQYELETLMHNPVQAGIEPVEFGTPALITFTTGSSGTPKGANRTHGFLASQHAALDQCLPYQADDLDLPIFPIFSLNNLAGGVTTILPAIDLAAPSPQDAERLVQQIQTLKATCCTLSPSLFIQLSEYCREQGIKLASLRRAVTGGAPVGRENLENFKTIAPRAEILVLYGSTEVEPIAHIEVEELLRGTSREEGVNVGKISPELEYKFIKIVKGNVELDSQGWQAIEQKKGLPGELLVSGAHVCPGYYRNQEAMKAVKITGPEGRLWHRTGDVGFLDQNDDLWIVGRVHNAICRTGEYLFPIKAELLLKQLDFVKQAAFLGRPDQILKEKTCVVISLKDRSTTQSEIAYREKILNLMKEHRIPVDEIIFREEIPMDPRHHSKVEYTKLREMLDLS